MITYRMLDIGFFVFHTAFILFVMSGWAWKKTRKAHLALVCVTALSWFGLGLVYGIGFCPCTEWHWRIREILGHRDLPESYIKYLLDSVTGLDLNGTVVDGTTFVVFAMAAILSVILNRWDKQRRVR